MVEFKKEMQCKAEVTAPTTRANVKLAVKLLQQAAELITEQADTLESNYLDLLSEVGRKHGKAGAITASQAQIDMCAFNAGIISWLLEQIAPILNAETTKEDIEEARNYVNTIRYNFAKRTFAPLSEVDKMLETLGIDTQDMPEVLKR